MQYALAAGAALAVTAPTPHPPAKHHAMPKYARQYARAYKAVQAKLGHRAPGRNIVRWGTNRGRRATDRQIVTSLGVLRRMLRPPVQLASPQTSSTTVSTASTSASTTGSLPTCTWKPESGGNPSAVNSSSGAGGYYQIMPSTWAAYGGTGAPQNAPLAEQTAVAQRIWAGQGPSAWVNC